MHFEFFACGQLSPHDVANLSRCCWKCAAEACRSRMSRTAKVGLVFGARRKPLGSKRAASRVEAPGKIVGSSKQGSRRLMGMISPLQKFRWQKNLAEYNTPTGTALRFSNLIFLNCEFAEFVDGLFLVPGVGYRPFKSGKNGDELSMPQKMAGSREMVRDASCYLRWVQPCTRPLCAGRASAVANSRRNRPRGVSRRGRGQIERFLPQAGL